jgi:hypothetical protein
MKKKIFVALLVAFFAWTVSGVGDVHAGSLEDMPSTGEFVMIGALAVMAVTTIIVLAVKSGDDAKDEAAAKVEDSGNAEETILVSGIEPVARPQVRIDPVLTLQKNGVGAGVAFSF